jgi:hypothetical protein
VLFDPKCSSKVASKIYIFPFFSGTCKNGTGAVGCGPQEEFRACADVSITEDDGSADSTPNVLVDPDVYVPFDETDEYNEVDYEDNSDYEKSLVDEVKIESVIIVALVSLLVTAAFFGALFFYYTRGKPYIDKYVGDREWPEMPKMPSVNLPKMPNVPKMNVPKMAAAVNWPLSNVQIKNLPNFLVKKSSKSSANTTTISAPIQVLGSAASSNGSEVFGGPRPPPRVKKQAPSPKQVPATHMAASSSQTVGVAISKNSSAAVASLGPRLATVTSRPHNGINLSRPSAPPPVVPPSVPVLEISQPTAVTINGVSVAVPASVCSIADEVTVHSATSDVASGMLVPARPAMADEDMPDSMDPQQSQMIPPPLPTCPPPGFDENESSGMSSTTSSTTSSEA